MKHKKIKMCALFILVLGIEALMAQSVLNVREKTGTITPFDLNTIKSITFSESNLIVNMKDTRSTAFTRTGIRYLNFSPRTGIKPNYTALTSLINIFPNPVKDVLHIDYDPNENVNHYIEIRSIDGKLMLTTIINPYENVISVAHLSRGFYICRVLEGTTWNSCKFIKQ